MPLIPTLLKTGIEDTLKPLLEPLIVEHTKKAFYDAMKKFKEVSEKGGINNVFENANTQASVVFGDVMKSLADDIAKSVANSISVNVDLYIKTATVIVPPGQVVVASGYPGVTTLPSPPALIT